jgi:hypothetical protein
MVPAMTLLWIGIKRWVPAPYRPQAAVALVAAFAIMDAAVWLLIAVPAYGS